jgi:hypothetical protein
LWGTFDPGTHKVKVTTGDAPGAVNLHELAAAWTLKNDGTVYIKKKEAMPVKAGVAAVLRYA